MHKSPLFYFVFDIFPFLFKEKEEVNTFNVFCIFLSLLPAGASFERL